MGVDARTFEVNLSTLEKVLKDPSDYKAGARVVFPHIIASASRFEDRSLLEKQGFPGFYAASLDFAVFSKTDRLHTQEWLRQINIPVYSQHQSRFDGFRASGNVTISVNSSANPLLISGGEVSNYLDTSNRGWKHKNWPELLVSSTKTKMLLTIEAILNGDLSNASHGRKSVWGETLPYYGISSSVENIFVDKSLSQLTFLIEERRKEALADRLTIKELQFIENLQPMLGNLDSLNKEEIEDVIYQISSWYLNIEGQKSSKINAVVSKHFQDLAKEGINSVRSLIQEAKKSSWNDSVCRDGIELLSDLTRIGIASGFLKSEFPYAAEFQEEVISDSREFSTLVARNLKKLPNKIESAFEALGSGWDSPDCLTELGETFPFVRATREYKIFDKEEKARQKLITEFEARGANSYSKVCASEIISDSFTKLKTAFDTLTPQQQKSLNEAVAACTWRKKEGPYNGSTYPEIFKILNSDECSETVRKDALKVMAEGASLQSSRFKGIVEFQEYSFCSSTLRPIFSSDGLKLSSFDRELLYLAYTGAGQESSLETFISDPSFANQLENAKKELQRNSDLNIEETLARIQSAANAFYTK